MNNAIYLDSELFKEVECKFEIYSNINSNINSNANVDINLNTNLPENNYLNLLRQTIINGNFRQTRNDSTWSDFSSELNFDVSKSFPLLTSKKMTLRLIFEELMFFIRGFTNNKILKDRNVHIWDSNTTAEFIQTNNKCYQNSDKLLEVDDMGPMYGFQLRYFNAPYDRTSDETTICHYSNLGYIDQLSKVLELIRTDPFSRRIIMTTFNPAQAENGVLYPCHSVMLQFYAKSNISNTYNLSLKMTQRSADLFHGLPFNIASTALMLYIICDYLNQFDSNVKYIPDRVILSLGDYHIYQSHLNAVLNQLQAQTYNFPQLTIKSKDVFKSIESYEYSDIELLNYNSSGAIKAQMIA